MERVKIRTFSVFVAVILGVVTAMAQRTGTVKESVSKIDGERQVAVVPGWLKGGKGLLSTSFLIGGFWSDRSPTNFMLQVVVLSGVPERLRVSIDGRIAKFEPYDANGHSWTSGDIVGIVRRFDVPLAFVEEMLKAETVVMEVQTSEGTKQEGTLVNGANMAKSGFRKALEKIRKSK